MPAGVCYRYRLTLECGLLPRIELLIVKAVSTLETSKGRPRQWSGRQFGVLELHIVRRFQCRLLPRMGTSASLLKEQMDGLFTFFTGEEIVFSSLWINNK